MLLLNILAFLSIVLITVGIYNLIYASRIGVVNRLDIYTREDDIYTKDENISIKEFILNIIGAIGRGISRKSYMENKKTMLSQAYIFMRVEEFLGISVIVALVIALLFLYLTKMWIVTIIGLFIGFKIPDVILTFIKKKRMKKLNSQLPETLSIISNGLRAGFSFTQAMSVATNQIESPIKDEFIKIIRDNSLGKTLDEALLDFSDRTDDEDVDMFITALIIQRKVGGNLAEILDTIASTIRDRVRIRGEIKTLTAQGRISAMVISALPFGVALIIFATNPSYILELFNNTFGIIMVVSAIVMQILGIFIITRMANIEI